METVIPKLSEVWVSFLAFGILFFVLARFAFPPIQRMLEERSEKIRESLEKAEETRVEAERLLDDYKEQMAEIDKAMTYFSDLIETAPGISAHRPPKDSGLTMGGWYAPLGHYDAERLGGLSISRFCEAVTSEGVPCRPGCNKVLHLHPLFNTLDVYRVGKPTRIANLPDGVDVRQPPGSLPVSEHIQKKVFRIPWFRRYHPEIIREYADAFRKVAENYEDILADDPGDPPGIGSWGMTRLRG